MRLIGRSVLIFVCLASLNGSNFTTWPENFGAVARAETGNCRAFPPPVDSRRSIKSIDDLGQAMTEGMLLGTHQEALFEIYRPNFFGNPATSIDGKNLSSVHAILKAHPELKKPQFREYQIQQVQRVYESPQKLDQFLKGQIRSAGQVRSNLFQIDANLGFWQKLVGLPMPKSSDPAKSARYKKHLLDQITTLFSVEERAQLAHPSTPYQTKLSTLFRRLSDFREWKLKRGRDVKVISQAMVDLVHTAGYGNAHVVEMLKSDDAMTRLEGFKKILDERDEIAERVGYRGHFRHLQNALGVDAPTGFSKNQNLNELLSGLERDVLQMNFVEKPGPILRVRPLSIQEAPFRSCLGGSDCSSRTYFDKALDPNFIYFTRTAPDAHSSGHVTVVLGEAKDGQGQKHKVAFIDKLQNVPNHEIPVFLEAVRQSLDEAGYRLALPANVGGSNGLSNMDTIRDFVQQQLLPLTSESLDSFTPHKNRYDFKNEYSRAYGRLPVRILTPLDLDAATLGAKILPGPIFENWSAPKELKPINLVQQVRAMRNSKDESEQLRYVRSRHLYAQPLLRLNPSEFTAKMRSFVRDPNASHELRKRAFYELLLSFQSSGDRNKALNELAELPSDLYSQIRGEINQWGSSSNEERKELHLELSRQIAEMSWNPSLFQPRLAERLIDIFGVNMPDHEGTLITSIIRKDSAPLLALLLKRPELEVNARADGKTALHIATRQNLNDSVTLLVRDPRTDLNAVEHSRREGVANLDAFHIALDQKNTEIALLLLQRPDLEIPKGAKTRHGTTLSTALMLSPRLASAVIRKQRGESIAEELNTEVVHPRFESLASLLRQYAHDKKFREHLFLEALSAQDNALDVMMEIGRTFTDIEIRQYSAFLKSWISKTPLQIGEEIKSSLHSPRLVWKLHESTLDDESLRKILIFVDRAFGLEKAFRWATDTHLKEAIRVGDERIVRAILEIHPTLAKDESERAHSPFLPFTIFKHPELVRTLQRAGVDINSGRKPAIVQAAREHESVFLEALRTPGVDVNVADFEGDTALHYLASRNSETGLRALLKMPGLDVNRQNNRGRTALHHAALGHSKALAILIQKPGIRTDIKDIQGETVFDQINSRLYDRDELLKAIEPPPVWRRWLDRVFKR